MLTTAKSPRNEKKKKEFKPEYDEYFMTRSPVPKKSKRHGEANVSSPRVHGSSRSSSKRESPHPKNFEGVKSPSAKTIKSPRKGMGMKSSRHNLNHYYF